MANMISPNDLQAAAVDALLDGRPPETRHDWQLVANFWAANVASGLEESAVPLIGLIFDRPLTKDELIAIARYQAVRKSPKVGA